MARITQVLLLIISFASLLACSEQALPDETATSTTSASDTSLYDPQLAEELGADDYGMKQYVMAFLKSGPNRDRSKEESQALQRAHLDNITRLAEAGKLILAGPFLDDGEIRGIYIFDVKTVEEAKSLTETDPAIQAGSLEMELHPWYGSAALIKLQEIHPKIAKKEI